MQGLSVKLHQEAPIPLDVELACAPGELLALVGPSGSGKSTILRSIAGLYRPLEAQVSIDGETWTDTSRGLHVATWKRRAGLVFQSYGLFPHMTAKANVEAALGHLDPAQRGRRAIELLTLVNLQGLESRRPAELSGGQQQRVAVARALAREPRVLLLDEPFSAVDKVTRGRLYEELAAIRTRLAMPILLVTHDLDEALMLADSMCLLQRGRILQHGRPIDVLQRPATVEAARLVGQRNIFPARVLEHRGDPATTILDWRGRQLEVAHQPKWAAGTEVAWLIPASKVVLHRRDRPSRGEAENPVAGTIVRHLVLGDRTICSIKLDGNETRTLTLQVPAHVAERNALAAGKPVALSLLASAIHIMPAAEPRKRKR
ncbi:MAG TPA: ABC transporter ATP-binding protein [Hyphomicrobiaceae bacterium]|nr:ABC transporter ATP-binding protein [Hyphomicrobiaceae bacterium]